MGVLRGRARVGRSRSHGCVRVGSEIEVELRVALKAKTEIEIEIELFL